MKRLHLAAALVVSAIATSASADPQGLDLAKASAKKVAEATCPLIGLLNQLSKAKPDTPEYDLLKIKIDEESKSLTQFKAEEMERLRSQNPQLTIKEGRDLNDYIDVTLANTCAPKKL